MLGDNPFWRSSNYTVHILKAFMFTTLLEVTAWGVTLFEKSVERSVEKKTKNEKNFV